MNPPGSVDWGAWHADLLEPALVHADAAGCSARSRGILDAVKRHLDLEATHGAYVAEEKAADEIEQGRARLSRLAGGGRVAFAQNATQAFRWLISVWPLPGGASVGMLTSEYEPNRIALERASERRGFRLVRLPSDPLGRLDLEGAEKLLPELDLVTFPHIPSQRGIAQPVEEFAPLCKTHGVDLVLDGAQALGQRDVSRVHPSAFVGTSRKWLQGPRGVGFVIVTDDRVRVDDPDGPEEGDGGIAERVGLAVALAEVERRGIDAIETRVRALAGSLRQRLIGRGRWEVIEPVDEASGSTTLRHPTHDPVAVVNFLRTRGIIAAAIPIERAPYDLETPLLRFSLHAYADEAWIDRILEEIPA